MNDAIARLRAVNPVLECEAPPVEELRMRLDIDPAPPYRHGRRRLVFGYLPALGLAIALALIILAGSLKGGGPSVLARALAATTSGGSLIHYVEISRVSEGASEPVISTRTEVWTSGAHSRSRVTNFLSGPSRQPGVSRLASGSREFVEGGAHARFYDASKNAIYRGRGEASLQAALLTFERNLWAGPAMARCIALSKCRALPADPLVVMRLLYRTKRLRNSGTQSLDGRDLDLITGANGREHLQLLVDPKTYVPVQAQTLLYGPHGKLELRILTRFKSYERLVLGAENRRLLQLAHHPGAVRVLGPFVDRERRARPQSAGRRRP